LQVAVQVAVHAHGDPAPQKVAVRADGGAVREDDAEPQALDDEAVELRNGQTVAMAVKELLLVWRIFEEERVTP
jgi:hypothetical protein